METSKERATCGRQLVSCDEKIRRRTKKQKKWGDKECHRNVKVEPDEQTDLQVSKICSHIVIAVRRLAYDVAVVGCLLDERRAREEKDEIRRFRRIILKGRKVGAFMQLLLPDPKFSFRVNTERGSIQFRCSFRVPETILKADPTLHWLVLGANRAALEAALTRAFSESKSGRKTFPECISEFLRRTCQSGFAELVSHMSDLGEYGLENFKEEQVQEFQAQAPIKRSQPNAQVALWAAERFDKIKLAIAELRQRLRGKSKNGQPKLDASRCSDEMYKSIPTVKPDEVLESSFREAKDVHSLLTARIGTAEIARAYVKCEAEQLKKQLRRCSVKRHIELGHKLRAALVH